MPIKAIIFDWGDTLMQDLPHQTGKMCDWPEVAEVAGATEALTTLSKKMPLYIATGAKESSQEDIQKAFARLNLNQYISGYFCQQNLGIGKQSEAFFPTILDLLDAKPHQVVMAGDSLQRVILPAQQLGMHTVWLHSGNSHGAGKHVRQIESLFELTELI